MVQFRVPALRESGLQASDVMLLSTVIRRRAIDVVCVLPFNVAVSVAVWSEAIVPAVAVKAAVVDPAATATDPGTVSAAVLLDSVTVPPPVFVSVTVQLLAPPVPSVSGVHDTELTAAAVAKGDRRRPRAAVQRCRQRRRLARRNRSRRGREGRRGGCRCHRHR